MEAGQRHARDGPVAHGTGYCLVSPIVWPRLSLRREVHVCVMGKWHEMVYSCLPIMLCTIM